MYPDFYRVMDITIHTELCIKTGKQLIPNSVFYTLLLNSGFYYLQVPGEAAGEEQQQRKAFFFYFNPLVKPSFSCRTSNPYRIAASSSSTFISFSVLNLMQYPVTLALPIFFPYVWAK